MVSLPPLSRTTGTCFQPPSLRRTPSQLLLIFAREAKQRWAEQRRRRHVFEEEEEEFYEQKKEEERKKNSKEKRRRQMWNKKGNSVQIVRETLREDRADLDNSDDYNTDLDVSGKGRCE